MPKVAFELGALAVSRLDKPGLHPVGGVPGLCIRVREPAAGKYWVLRVCVAGKRRDIGIGGYPEIGLAAARDKARQLRDAIRAGRDPVAERHAARSALRAAVAATVTFDQAAERYIASHRAAWRNPKHAQQWENTLRDYASPVLGALDVRDIETRHVLAAIEPMWADKTETAKRLRGRLELVLDWAAARGYRDASNPARWRGHLDKLLARPSKVARSRNFPALPAERVGAFMAALRECGGTGASCLRFSILTATRSGEARGALWSEIDLAAATWTIPAARTKTGKPHRVPLSADALSLLRALPRFVDGNGEPSPLVFQSPRGGLLSDMTLTQQIRRLDAASVKDGGAGWRDPEQGNAIATAHGIARASFRTWGSSLTSYPRDLLEKCLAHALESRVEAAYDRGDAFERRRAVMDAWAGFCATAQPAAGAVIPLRARAK